MKKVLLSSAVLSMMIFGCSKEDIIEAKPVQATSSNTQTTDYMPLQVGNYWVYDTYKIDTLNNETIISSNDSAYIDRDTTINGNVFYIVEGDFNAKTAIGTIIRNENNSIYNFFSGTEKLMFTTNNLGTIYGTDTISGLITTTTKTLPNQTNVTVPSGTFLSYNQEFVFTPLLTNYPWGTRTQYRHYNSGVGVIKNQYYYYSSPDYNESRLVRYNVK